MLGEGTEREKEAEGKGYDVLFSVHCQSDLQLTNCSKHE